MDTGRFWELVESARAAAGPIGADLDDRLADALIERLAALPPADIVAFERRFEELRGRFFDREDVYGAAFVISDGCGDDSYSDFRAGVVGLGRDWYELVDADPDQLADHPAVRAVAAGALDRGVLMLERFQYAAQEAYERVTGDESGLDRALAAAGPIAGGTADEAEPRALPRLEKLFPATYAEYARSYLA